MAHLILYACLAEAKVRTADNGVNSTGRHEVGVNMETILERKHGIYNGIFVLVQNAADQDDGKARNIRKEQSVLNGICDNAQLLKTSFQGYRHQLTGAAIIQRDHLVFLDHG